MISCVDELVLLAVVCLLIGDANGCNVPGKFIGLGPISCCVVKFILFCGEIELHIGADCCEFQFMDAFIPLEFQFIGLLACNVCELSVGDIRN